LIRFSRLILQAKIEEEANVSHCIRYTDTAKHYYRKFGEKYQEFNNYKAAQRMYEFEIKP
jgi:hypothetical protein